MFYFYQKRWICRQVAHASEKIAHLALADWQDRSMKWKYKYTVDNTRTEAREPTKPQKNENYK